MNGLLAMLLCNLLVASLIAAFAVAAGRWSRRPALTHGLWLLFFLKLLTPPLFPIQISWGLPEQQESQVVQTQAEVFFPPAVQDRSEEMAQEPSAGGGELAEVRAPQEPIVSADPSNVDRGIATLPHTSGPADEPTEFPWAQVWTGLWLTGSCCWLSLAGARLLRFRKQLRFAEPAPANLQREARHLAEELQVTCPGVWVLPGPVSPMLWVLGYTPRLLVPAGLLERLDDVQRQALLVHELAHWRRRDHWVRWLELAVLGVYWWCPLVWWARRQMQEAEEECCDAWVLWMMPGAARCYALALVETLDFVANARTVLPPAASGIGHVRLLQRRLTMIMRGTTPRTLTLSGGLAVLGLGALLLPLMPSWAQSPSPAPPGGGGQPDPFAREAFRDKLQALEKAQQDIHRIQEELDRARQDLERRTQELNAKIEQVKKAASEASKTEAGTLGGRKSGTVRGGAQGPAGFPGGPGGGGFGGGGGAFAPGQGGFGGGGMAGGIGVPPGSDVDRRLREMERKLDMLINMMRQGARPGAPGAMAPPQAVVPGTQGQLIGPSPAVVPPGATPRVPRAPLPPTPLPAAPAVPVDPATGIEAQPSLTPGVPTP
jgi:beta-lactamase regulating signal transducer with metallopeptidase domain